MNDITVNCMVLNEENFVKPALLSVLPLADKILVYDTGSTDSTIEQVESIGSDKIRIVKKGKAGQGDLSRYHSEMIDQADTEWFIIVDGDEIYPRSAIEAIKRELPKVPQDVHRIVLHRRHFSDSYNFLVPTHSVGRIYRTSKVRWRGDYGVQTPYLKDDPETDLKTCSIVFPEDAYFFHCHSLSRSSKDRDVGKLRRRRVLRFPAKPFFGPWPEDLDVSAADKKMSIKIFLIWLAMNLKIVWRRCAIKVRKIPVKLGLEKRDDGHLK